MKKMEEQVMEQALESEPLFVNAGTQIMPIIINAASMLMLTRSI